MRISGRFDIGDGLSARPALRKDKAFLEQLYRDTRDDLRLADADPDYIEAVIDMQVRARESGYGAMHPNHIQLVIEKVGEAVGGMILGPDADGVRLIDLAFIRPLRNKGHGLAVLGRLQGIAAASKAPLRVTLAVGRADLRQACFLLGFEVEDDTDPSALLLHWTPGRSPAPFTVKPPV